MRHNFHKPTKFLASSNVCVYCMCELLNPLVTVEILTYEECNLMGDVLPGHSYETDFYCISRDAVC